MSNGDGTGRANRMRLALIGAIAFLLAVIGGMAYLGHVRQGVLAGRIQNLQARLEAAQPANATTVEEETRRLKEALSAAESERDRLAGVVSSCGPDGCAALAGKLARAEDEVKELRRQQHELRGRIAALMHDGKAMRDRLAHEFAGATGQKLNLVEIARFGPFDIGSSVPTERQLAEWREELQPFRNAPLLVVGVADFHPYKGPSADLKQLGLMLSRARLVKEMGFEVYYQVRQNDPEVPESRGIVVYQMSIQATEASSAPGHGASQAISPFFTSQ
jgi:hypothetical protein